MRIGVVFPPRFIGKVSGLIRDDFASFEPIDCSYGSYDEAFETVNRSQSRLDAVFFGCKTLYILTKKLVKPTVPWGYIPQSGSTLYSTLLKVTQSKRCDICNISIDSFSSIALNEAYEEIGIPKERLNIYLAESDPASLDYLDSLYSFHYKLLRERKVTCCLTALDSIYRKLQAAKLPVIKIEPTGNIIRKSLHKLLHDSDLQVDQQNQIVTAHIQIDSQADLYPFNYDEYLRSLDKTKINNQIYLFAKERQAVILEMGERDYLLFTTQQTIEADSITTSLINLLEMIQKNTGNTVSIGIGYGNTVPEAKQNADIGMIKSSSTGGNRAFIVYNKSQALGPIKRSLNSFSANHSERNERFQQIAEEAGININTVIRLYNIVNESGDNIFLPSDLSKKFGVTPRTMNRILIKLEDVGVCSIIGKKSSPTGGRPSRIIQLNLQ
jgi:hypothetical protein